MALSYRRTISVDLAQDTSFKELLLQRDEVARTATYQEHAGGTIKIGASATVALSFGTVADAAVVLLETDTDVSVVFDGGTDETDLKAPTGGKAVLWHDGVSHSAISVENKTAAEATVYYMVAGA